MRAMHNSGRCACNAAVGIVCVDVVADGLVELDDGAEDAAFEAPFGQGGEQALDGIDP